MGICRDQFGDTKWEMGLVIFLGLFIELRGLAIYTECVLFYL